MTVYASTPECSILIKSRQNFRFRSYSAACESMRSMFNAPSAVEHRRKKIKIQQDTYKNRDFKRPIYRNGVRAQQMPEE